MNTNHVDKAKEKYHHDLAHYKQVSKGVGKNMVRRAKTMVKVAKKQIKLAQNTIKQKKKLEKGARTVANKLIKRFQKQAKKKDSVRLQEHIRAQRKVIRRAEHRFKSHVQIQTE